MGVPVDRQMLFWRDRELTAQYNFKTLLDLHLHTGFSLKGYDLVRLALFGPIGLFWSMHCAMYRYHVDWLSESDGNGATRGALERHWRHLLVSLLMSAIVNAERACRFLAACQTNG